jgi:hypothetical protein
MPTLSPQQIQIRVLELVGYKWYWRVSGMIDGAFTWKLYLAYPPEEGIGKAWLGGAGETREATKNDIELAMKNRDYTNHGPPVHESINAIREFVMKEDDSFQQRFAFELHRIARTKLCHDHQLTALDWCIAFIRAKGEEV